MVYAWVGDDPCGDGDLPPWSGVTCSQQGDYRVVTELYVKFLFFPLNIDVYIKCLKLLLSAFSLCMMDKMINDSALVSSDAICKLSIWLL